MRGIPRRAPGSNSSRLLRDRFSTRQRVEIRKNVRKPADGSSQNTSKTSSVRKDNPHQSSRPGDSKKKLLVSTRPRDGLSRRLPMTASARGNRLRLPTKQFTRGRDGNKLSRSLYDGPQRSPRFRKPNSPNQRFEKRHDQRNMNDGSYQSEASENFGHQGQPVQSTKSLLFQGPKKAWKYREEDLKKIKIDIRPSRSELGSVGNDGGMFDRAELKKLKVDIKGDHFDSRRENVMYRDSHGVPYDKKVLESVKVNIKRKLGPEVVRGDDLQSHTIKRNLELDKFCVPQYKERQMLNSRPTFTHASGPKEFEKRDLSLKVNIVRQVPNPTNEPLRDEFHEDSFKMYRQRDVSPPRGNRKVIVAERNNQARDNQEYLDSRKIQSWQDEGSKPVFSNKNVTPNTVHLADIFPSERDRRESHSRPPPRHSHLDRPPQKYSEHDRDRQPRQRDRGGELLDDRRHPPSSKEPAHSGRSYSGKPYGQTDLGARDLLPQAGEGKGQPRQSSDARSRDYEMRRSSGRERHEVQPRNRSPPLFPPLRPHDNFKPSDRPGRKSRSRSPLGRSSGNRDHPPRGQRPFSPPRGQRPFSPPRGALTLNSLSPRRPDPLEDKYRDKPFVEDKYRDKPFGDDKYRSDRPNLREKFRSEKPVPDNYRDKPFGDDKFRDKPLGDDKYRDKPFGDDKFRDKPFGDDKYRDKPFGDDKYRDKPFGDDKYRDKPFGDDKYRDKPFGDDKYRDKPFGDDKYRDKPFGDDKYRDKPFGDDKYRDKPFGDDKYRDKPFGDDKYRDKPFGDDKYRSSKPEPAFEDAYRKPVDRSRPEDKYRPRLDQDPFGDKYRGDKPRPFDLNYRTDKPYEDKYRSTEKARPFEDNKLYRNDKPASYEDKYRTDKLSDNYREKVAPYEDKYRQDKIAPYNDKFRSDKPSHYDDKYRSDKPAAPFQDNYRTDSRLSGALDSGSRRDLPPSGSARHYSPSNGWGGERRRESQEERRGTSPRPPFSSDPKKNRDYYMKHSGVSGGGVGTGVGQDEVAPMQLQMIPVISHPGVGMGVFSPFIRPLQQPLAPAPRTPLSYNMHPPYRPARK